MVWVVLLGFAINVAALAFNVHQEDWPAASVSFMFALLMLVFLHASLRRPT